MQGKKKKKKKEMRDENAIADPKYFQKQKRVGKRVKNTRVECKLAATVNVSDSKPGNIPL
jgi:hypothetical protein